MAYLCLRRPVGHVGKGDVMLEGWEGCSVVVGGEEYFLPPAEDVIQHLRLGMSEDVPSSDVVGCMNSFVHR